MPEWEGGRIKGQGRQEPVKVAKQCPADKNEGAGWVRGEWEQAEDKVATGWSPQEASTGSAETGEQTPRGNNYA